MHRAEPSSALHLPRMLLTPRYKQHWLAGGKGRRKVYDYGFGVIHRPYKELSFVRIKPFPAINGYIESTEGYWSEAQYNQLTKVIRFILYAKRVIREECQPRKHYFECGAVDSLVKSVIFKHKRNANQMGTKMSLDRDKHPLVDHLDISKYRVVKNDKSEVDLKSVVEELEDVVMSRYPGNMTMSERLWMPRRLKIMAPPEEL